MHYLFRTFTSNSMRMHTVSMKIYRNTYWPLSTHLEFPLGSFQEFSPTDLGCTSDCFLGLLSIIERTIPWSLQVLVPCTLVSSVLVFALWLPSHSSGPIVAFSALYGLFSGKSAPPGIEHKYDWFSWERCFREPSSCLHCVEMSPRTFRSSSG